MSRRHYEVLFLALAIVLVVFVGLVNCLQGTVFAGGLKCNLDYTSSDLVVKILASVIFVIFLGLIFGPIAAVVIQSIRGKPTKPIRADR